MVVGARVTVEAGWEEAAEKEVVVGCTATADRSVSTQHVADSKELAEGLYTSICKLRIEQFGIKSSSRGRFATPADFLLRDCTPKTGKSCDAKVQAMSLVQWRTPHCYLVLMGRAVHTADWVWPWRQLETACPLDRANIW
jgi:hypothetical protein